MEKNEQEAINYPLLIILILTLITVLGIIIEQAQHKGTEMIREVIHTDHAE